MAWPNGVADYRRWLILSWHILLLSATYYACFLMRFDFLVEQRYQWLFLKTLPIILLIKIPILSFSGLMRGWWRYAGIADLVDIVKVSIVSSLTGLVVIRLFFFDLGFPRSVLLIDLVLTVCALGGVRLSVRIYQETAGRAVPRKNTIIVGAGAAGSRIAWELKGNSQLDLNVIGYVDDDETKQDIKIHGIRVLGRIKELPQLVERHRAKCLLIAMPSINGMVRRSILEHCNKCKAELKILPSISERINGGSALAKVRNVRIEDLIGRPPVSLDVVAIQRKLTDSVLMITGAGGSIGSELVRQLAALKPRRLILLERAENHLHEIDVELQRRFPGLNYVPLVGDILDVRMLREVMAEYRPHSVFHAAAYKHVPMMEKNCFSAVVNNVFGTYNVALVARQYEVEDFLMISSDKAVNPTNIMGVTKRVAELVILGLQHQHTRYVSVRFGNVLGSSGSVLPLFERQLVEGGPLTVTHPEARRYFMTIPEAVQLVLQASTMGNGGEIFVLEMGSPIRIVDLAKNLIRFSGLDPETDIPIIYTGLRPGEKLFEELSLVGEGIKKTSHPKIKVLDGGQVDFSKVTRWLDELSALVERKNIFGLVQKLQEIVPEYTPSPELLSLCQLDRHDVVSEYRRAQSELIRTAIIQPRDLGTAHAD